MSRPSSTAAFYQERRRVCRKVQNEAKRLRHHQDAAGFRSWDACFCEVCIPGIVYGTGASAKSVYWLLQLQVITQQQTAASRLVAAIENRQAEAEKVWELQERRDPKMTLMQLRLLRLVVPAS